MSDTSVADKELIRIGLDDEDYPKYADKVGEWDIYIYAFNGKKFRLNPEYVANDKMTQLLIESGIYVREEAYGS